MLEKSLKMLKFSFEYSMPLKGHTSATWQGPFNSPCVAAMQPVVKSL